MLIEYRNQTYQCEKVFYGTFDIWRGKRLFKNGRTGKRNKYFPICGEGKYYTIKEEER
jgi:hypothetical protein